MYLFSSLFLPFSMHRSNVQNATSFQHMARMMDSLILNEFPPYTFTKITTTHRPTRTSNGIATSKLLAKSTANLSSTASNSNNNNINNNNPTNVASVLGMNGGLRQTSLQKSKVPMQGRQLCFLDALNDLFFLQWNYIYIFLFHKLISLSFQKTNKIQRFQIH